MLPFTPESSLPFLQRASSDCSIYTATLNGWRSALEAQRSQLEKAFIRQRFQMSRARSQRGFAEYAADFVRGSEFPLCVFCGHRLSAISPRATTAATDQNPNNLSMNPRLSTRGIILIGPICADDRPAIP